MRLPEPAGKIAEAVEQKISVREILAKYSHIRMATRDDNEAILAFFKNVSMKTSNLSLTFERAPDFFHLLEHQAESSLVGIFENTDGTIGGVATFALRTSYVDGEPVQAAYLSDLRLSPRLSRETRLQWRQFYRDILQNAHRILEFGGCRYFYSAILDENMAAVRAFTRDRSDIMYREIGKYRTISILGRLPWPFRKRAPAHGPGAGVRVRKASREDAPALRAFLHEQNRDRLFGHYFDPESPADELHRRMGAWEGFSLEGFFLATDSAGKIVGCVYPWAPERPRKLVLHHIPWMLRLIGWLLPLIGRRRITQGKALKMLYLTHAEVSVEFDPETRIGIFRRVLDEIFDSGLARQHHLISFFDFDCESLRPAVEKRGYVFQTTPATLYQVIHRNHAEQGGLLPPPENRSPGFDIGIA